MTDPTQSTTDPAAPPPPVPPAAAEAASSADGQEDLLAKLTYQDVPTFKEEIRGMRDVTPEQLQDVIHGTVMSLIRALGGEVYKLRGWLLMVREGDVNVMDEVIQRVEEIESLVYGGDSQLVQADADLFANIVGACEAFAEQALAATADSAGKEQLTELLALCAQGKARIDEIVVSGDGDDDEGDDDGDED